MSFKRLTQGKGRSTPLHKGTGGHTAEGATMGAMAAPAAKGQKIPPPKPAPMPSKQR